MRIVHVEDFIHPDAGYQVNLLSKLQVEQGHEVHVVTGEMQKMPRFLTDFFGKDNIPERDTRFFERTGVKIHRVPLYAYVSGRAIFKASIFKTVSGLNPDIVFVHGEDTLTGMQFIVKSLWERKYPIVLDCHMVEMASENRFRRLFRWFYKIFITPIILKKGIPLIRVTDVDYVEKCLGIPLNKTCLLSFGTDTSYFKPDNDKKKEIRRKYNIGENAFVVLYAGKLDVYKGGLILAEALKKKIHLHNGKDFVAVVIGNTSGEYGRQVEEVFCESENRILRFPTQNYYDLLPFYQLADVAVFPRQCSMSFFEAQSCGLPVIFEKNEINCQRIVNENAIIFDAEDAASLRAKMIEMGNLDKDRFMAMSKSAREYVLDSYNFVEVAKRFTNVLEDELKRFREERSHSKK